MRADRLVSLVLLLQARGRVTAGVLAAELGVSVRTIYRDLVGLSAAGVPVYAESGPNGGCQLVDGYRFPLRGLRPEEAEALLMLGVPDVLRELGLDGATRQSRRGRPAGGTHETCLPQPSTAGSQALVHLDMPPWFRSEEAVPELRVLAEALRQQRQLELGYSRAPDGRTPDGRTPDGRTSDGRTPAARAPVARTVTPLGLVNKAGIWYLVARTKGLQTTVFRAARISSARLMTAAARPAGFDLVAFWQQWSQEFAASLPKLQVTLRASPLALEIFPEVFGDQVRQALDAATAPDAAGWRELALSFEHEKAAAHRLAGFGAELEVISPLAVRERLQMTARGILSRYG